MHKPKQTVLKMNIFSVCNARIFFAKRKPMNEFCRTKAIIFSHPVSPPQPSNPPLSNQSTLSHNITCSYELITIYVIGRNDAKFSVLNI